MLRIGYWTIFSIVVMFGFVGWEHFFENCIGRKWFIFFSSISNIFLMSPFLLGYHALALIFAGIYFIVFAVIYFKEYGTIVMLLVSRERWIRNATKIIEANFEDYDKLYIHLIVMLECCKYWKIPEDMVSSIFAEILPAYIKITKKSVDSCVQSANVDDFKSDIEHCREQFLLAIINKQRELDEYHRAIKDAGKIASELDLRMKINELGSMLKSESDIESD